MAGYFRNPFLCLILGAMFLFDVANVVPAHATTNSAISTIERKLNSCRKSNNSDSDEKTCLFRYNAEEQGVIDQIVEKLRTSWVNSADGSAGDGGGAEARRINLESSQKAWVQSSNANCELVAAAMYGGSGADLEQLICIHAANLDRVRFLDELVKY